MSRRTLASVFASIALIASLATSPAAATPHTGSGDVITVCKTEELNTKNPSGEPLTDEELERAILTVQSYCDSLDRVFARDTHTGFGTYLTIIASANRATSNPCSCDVALWNIKVTAVGLPQAQNKNVNLIYRTNPPGASGGAWQNGPSNYVGPTTTYASLPAQYGEMPPRWKVEGFAAFFVGSTQRDTASTWAATY